jgi:glycosyltransferase involved in cell wall biosynthesis
MLYRQVGAIQRIYCWVELELGAIKRRGVDFVNETCWRFWRENVNSAKNAHLALFVPSLRGGGAERVMLSLAEGFANRGFSVDLVLAKAEGSYLKDVSNKVRVVDLNAGRVIKSLLGLVRYLGSEKSDAMLSAMGHANIVAVWARSLAMVSTRVVVSEHRNLTLSVQNSPSKRTYFMPWLMRIFYPWADAVVAVSNGAADDLAQVIKLPRERITTIYNPVVTPELLRKAKESVDHPWFRPEAPPIILGVGRLTKAKDFPTLIRAFALVRKERTARLMILGEGEERHDLEGLSKKLGVDADVDMPGFVDNPYKYMSHAAAFVLSSRWEGLPTVLIEAMACGCPVASIDCPSGPAEILENGKYGKLVAVGDVAVLAGAVLTILDAPEYPNAARRPQAFGMGKAVREYLKVLLPAGAVVGAGG